ncbi:MAG TPA: DNA-binding protein [Lentisphaeria bacterium]|nr:DNA-binding protein [Lentisphaeria bacterium]
MGLQKMKYVIDSNIWIYAAAGNDIAINALNDIVKAELKAYSALTRLEIFRYKNLSSDEECKLKSLFDCFEELEISSDIIDTAIEIRKLHNIKIPDAIIAATAINYRAALITRNVADFKNITHLNLLDPFFEK